MHPPRNFYTFLTTDFDDRGKKDKRLSNLSLHTLASPFLCLAMISCVSLTLFLPFFLQITGSNRQTYALLCLSPLKVEDFSPMIVYSGSWQTYGNNDKNTIPEIAYFSDSSFHTTRTSVCPCHSI